MGRELEIGNGKRVGDTEVRKGICVRSITRLKEGKEKIKKKSKTILYNDWMYFYIYFECMYMSGEFNLLYYNVNCGCHTGRGYRKGETGFLYR